MMEGWSNWRFCAFAALAVAAISLLVFPLFFFTVGFWAWAGGVLGWTLGAAIIVTFMLVVDGIRERKFW